MTKLSKEDLKNIKAWLPEDGIETLAKEFDLQPSTVQNILRGSQNNDSVLRRALEMAANEKIKFDKQRSLLAS